MANTSTGCTDDEDWREAGGDKESWGGEIDGAGGGAENDESYRLEEAGLYLRGHVEKMET